MARTTRGTPKVPQRWPPLRLAGIEIKSWEIVARARIGILWLGITQSHPVLFSDCPQGRRLVIDDQNIKTWLPRSIRAGSGKRRRYVRLRFLVFDSTNDCIGIMITNYRFQGVGKILLPLSGKPLVQYDLDGAILRHVFTLLPVKLIP